MLAAWRVRSDPRGSQRIDDDQVSLMMTLTMRTTSWAKQDATERDGLHQGGSDTTRRGVR